MLLNAYTATGGRPRVLLTTPPGEPHRLGMDMVAVVLAAQGASCHLLGASTPVTEVVTAAMALDRDVVGVSLSDAFAVAEARGPISALNGALPRHTELWLGGRVAAKPPIAAIATSITDWAGLDRALTRCWAAHRAPLVTSARFPPRSQRSVEIVEGARDFGTDLGDG